MADLATLRKMRAKRVAQQAAPADSGVTINIDLGNLVGALVQRGERVPVKESVTPYVG